MYIHIYVSAAGRHLHHHWCQALAQDMVPKLTYLEPSRSMLLHSWLLSGKRCMPCHHNTHSLSENVLVKRLNAPCEHSQNTPNPPLHAHQRHDTPSDCNMETRCLIVADASASSTFGWIAAAVKDHVNVVFSQRIHTCQILYSHQSACLPSTTLPCCQRHTPIQLM